MLMKILKQKTEKLLFIGPKTHRVLHLASAQWRKMAHGLVRATLPTPRPQLGPRPGNPFTAWAESWPAHSWPLIMIRRPCARIGRTKRPPRGRAPLTLASLFSSSVSLLAQRSSGSHPRQPAEEDDGTAAGPLAGARTRPRVSVLPSSGLWRRP